MDRNAVIAHLDKFLKPLGFKRRAGTWNRRGASVVEVISIQLSKDRYAVTVNAGVLDPEVRAILWGEEPEKFVDQPTCTVGVRIGELIDRYDRWWNLDDEALAVDMEAKIKVYVLPFLERVRTREAMERWFIEANVKKNGFPSQVISLAIIKKLLGDAGGACALLSELRKKKVGAWQVTIDEMTERFGCE